MLYGFVCSLGHELWGCPRRFWCCSPHPAVSTSSAPTWAGRNTSSGTKSTSRVTGKPDVVLATFDGSIEIRPWDKPDVQVVVEKRGRDKDDVAGIDVQATQNGNRIEVTVTEPKNRGGFNIHFNNHRSAKLIVSLPATSDVVAPGAATARSTSSR